MESSSFILKALGFLTFYVHLSSAETHSYQYFYTGVTGINFPEFTAVGLVDGEQISYYDSNSRRETPKTEWIKNAVDPDFWDRNTLKLQGAQELFKVNVATLMQRFNQTKGLHVVQRMYGCELHDDGTIRGHNQFGYDGADFLSFDLKTLTWTVANAKAVITKNKWDSDVGFNKKEANYLKNICIDWLKKYVSYGRETLERKVPPEALMFQKFSSSPELVCHATGFFPSGVMMSWQKDREDLIEDVELRETLPNQDGSFQKRSILKVSPEDLQEHEYTCVIKHSSLKKDLVLKANDPWTRSYIIGGSIALVCLFALCIGGGFLCKKFRDTKRVRSSNDLNSDSVLLRGFSDRVTYASGDTTHQSRVEAEAQNMLEEESGPL